MKQLMKPSFWKYHNEGVITHYIRYETPDGKQAIKEISDEQLKMFETE